MMDYEIEIIVNKKNRQKKAIKPSELLINNDITLKDLLELVNKQSIIIEKQDEASKKSNVYYNKKIAVLEARIVNLENTVKELGGNL